MLFMMGVFVGWTIGFILMAIFTVGKREDLLSDELHKKLIA